MKTIYLGDLRCEAEHMDSGSKIRTVAPKDNNGDGSLFSPTDLFATSLGCCMLTIIGMTARTHGFSIDGTTVTTEKVMAAKPRRAGRRVRARGGAALTGARQKVDLRHEDDPYASLLLLAIISWMLSGTAPSAETSPITMPNT